MATPKPTARTSRKATGTPATAPVVELNKFERSISNGSGALAERGALVARAVKLAQEDKVRGLESEINNLRLSLHKLCDVSPENTQDTKPRGLAAEDPKAWVDQVHNLKMQIALKEEELAVALETLNEWF